MQNFITTNPRLAGMKIHLKRLSGLTKKLSISNKNGQTFYKREIRTITLTRPRRNQKGFKHEGHKVLKVIRIRAKGFPFVTFVS